MLIINKKKTKKMTEASVCFACYYLPPCTTAQRHAWYFSLGFHLIFTKENHSILWILDHFLSCVKRLSFPLFLLKYIFLLFSLFAKMAILIKSDDSQNHWRHQACVNVGPGKVIIQTMNISRNSPVSYSTYILNT